MLGFFCWKLVLQLEYTFCKQFPGPWSKTPSSPRPNIFSPRPVVLLSSISRFVLVRKQIDSNTNGWNKKNWTGRSSFVPNEAYHWTVRIESQNGFKVRLRCCRQSTTFAGKVVPTLSEKEGVCACMHVSISSLGCMTLLSWCRFANKCEIEKRLKIPVSGSHFSQNRGCLSLPRSFFNYTRSEWNTFYGQIYWMLFLCIGEEAAAAAF